MSRVLVVTPVELDAPAVERTVEGHAGTGAQTLVVVPATEVSKLQLLTGEVDQAREHAEAVASSTGAPAVVGDSDPVQAVEDALREFGADEIVVVTRPDAEADWLEGGAAAEALRRFSLPVTHLVVDEDGGTPREPAPDAVRPYSEGHDVARGAADSTPASLLGRVAAVVWGVAALVAVILVILWAVLR